MESELFLGKVAQRAIIGRDKKILITRDQNNELFGLPGGRLDKDEQTETGLKREIREELGVEINIIGILSTDIEDYAGGPHYIVTFMATLSDSKAPITPDTREVAEARWISKDDLTSVKLYKSCDTAVRSYFAKGF